MYALANALNALVEFSSKAVFPYPDDFPAHLSKGSGVAAVASSVLLQLREPIGTTRSRDGRVQWALMPEATVHENGDLRVRKNKVRTDKPVVHSYGAMAAPPGHAAATQSLGQREFRAGVTP